MPQSGKAGPFIGIIVVSIKKIRAKTPAVGSARSMSHGSLESIFILFLGQIFCWLLYKKKPLPLQAWTMFSKSMSNILYMYMCVLKSCWVGDGRRWATTILTIESLSVCIIPTEKLGCLSNPW